MENKSQEKNNKRLIFMLGLDRTLPRDRAIQKLKTEGWKAFKKYKKVTTKVILSNQQEQLNTHPVRCI